MTGTETETETAADAGSLDAGPGRGPGGVADPRDGAEGPVRRCLASGERKPQAAMIRFVLAPDGSVTPDLAGRLPGRGMWLSADARSIKTAVERRLFAKAARAKAVAPADLDARVGALLARRCVETLSLARRAGEAVTGFEKVRAALTAGRVAVLVEASDGAEDGRRKLRAALAAGGGRNEGRDGKTAPILVDRLTADEIGEAFGRDRAVHAALVPGGLADRLAREAARLAGFRDGVPDAGVRRSDERSDATMKDDDERR